MAAKAGRAASLMNAIQRTYWREIAQYGVLLFLEVGAFALISLSFKVHSKHFLDNRMIQIGHFFIPRIFS